jgi:WD40 repeat protein
MALPRPERTGRQVLVVDQFEEVFTLCSDEDERAAFVEQLVQIAGNPDDAVVVLGLRGDYYGHCGAYPELAQLLSANQVLVGPMSADELRRAIELPARRAGVRAEAALIQALVEEIADEPGGLPLLSTALVELWQERDGDWLRLGTYERLGGVRSAVARLAESSYENLGDDQRDAVRRLFLRLVAIGDEGALAKRRVPLSELDLDRDPRLAGVVNRLTADRLLTADESSVEVAHEALLREWPRFQDWLAGDAQGRELREHLTQSAKRWDAAAREPAELYRGARLTATLDWAASRDEELNALEREFLAESRSQAELQAERQRRQNRRLRGALVIAALLLAIAIAGGIVALQQRSSAQHEAAVALGRQLGAEAVSQPRIDLSMLLGRESLNLDRSLQTEGTLLATLLREPAVTGTFTMPIQERPQEVKVSPDGHTIAVVTNSNVMHFYDTRTHRQVRQKPIYNGEYAYDPSSGDLIAGDPRPAQPDLWLVDPRTGRVLQTLTISKLWQTTYSSAVEPTVVTRDGRYGIVLWAEVKPDGSNGPAYAEVWRLDHSGPSRLVPLGGSGMIAATALFGDRFAVAGAGWVSTWDALTLKQLSRVRGPSFEGQSLVNGAVSPDGRTFAYGLGDGSVHFFDIATGRTTNGVGGHSAGVQRIAFSPDSRIAASVGDDGLAIVWDPSKGTPIERLTGHTGRVLGVDFGPDSRTVYTASLDGSILQYDLGGSRRFGSPFTVGTPGAPPPPHTAVPQTPLLAVSPDGRTFASGILQSSVNFYTTSSLRRTGTISIARGRYINSGTWAGSHFVLGADHGLVQLWNVTGARPRPGAVLHGLSRQAEVRSTAAADGGRLVAAVDGWYGPAPGNGAPPPHEGEFALWRDGKLVGGRVVNLHTFGDWVALSRDGSLAAVAVDNGTVLVVDTATGQTERTIKPQTGAITVAFAPDGTLASGSWPGIVDLWNPKTGRKIGHDLLVAPAPVASLAFAPDGQTFATSGGSSGHTKIWVTSTQQQLGTDLPGGDGFWGNAAYTPDGRYLLSVYGDGSAERWPVSVSAWEDHACAVAGRNATTEEWRRFVGGRSYSKICP